MMRRRTRSVCTLATARLELGWERRRVRRVLIGVFASLLAAVAVGAAWWYGDGSASRHSLGALRQDNATMRAELERLRAELQLERSVRSALDGQVAELSASAGELRSQLDFVAAQSNRPPRRP